MTSDYKIPVMMRLEKGRYKKAWAKSLTPDRRGNIRVRYESGSFSSWAAEKTIEIENYNIINITEVNDL